MEMLKMCVERVGWDVFVLFNSLMAVQQWSGLFSGLCSGRCSVERVIVVLLGLFLLRALCTSGNERVSGGDCVPQHHASSAWCC